MKLSKEQKIAIEAPLAPGLIVAGAGTGKTSVMVERVVHLVKNSQINPEEILGLTFTNKAAGEFKERTIKRLKQEKLKNINLEVSTYHSFAHNLVMNHGLRIGLDTNNNILTDSSRAQFVYRVVKNTKLPLPYTEDALATVVKKIIKLDNELAEHDISIETLIAQSENFISRVEAHGGKQAIMGMAKVARYRLDLALLVKEFREAKVNENVIDFADQLRFALQIVREHEAVGEELRETYKTVLLDEYQDTSVTQRILLQKIFGKGHPVTAVGDQFQAIYGWRGAAVSNIEQFQEHFKKVDGSPADLYYLKANYRSGQNILDVANEISDPLRSESNLAQVLIADPDRKDQAKVEISLSETNHQEIALIVKQIKQISKTRSLSDVAILARKATVLDEIYAELLKNKIPANYVGSRELINAPEVRELLSYLQIIEDPTHNPSLIRILTSPRFEVSLRDIKLLADRARTLLDLKRIDYDNANLDELLTDAVSGFDVAELAILSDALADPGDSAYGEGVLQIFQELNEELDLLRRFQSEPLIDFIYRVLMQTNLFIELQIHNDDSSNNANRAIQEFLKIAHQFASAESDISLSNFLNWIQVSEDLDEDIKYQALPEKDSVTLITVHSAKGLQWPIVFLPQIVSGVFPDPKTDSWIKKAELLPYWIRQDAASLQQLSNFTSKTFDAYLDELSQSHLNEERRLFYVAITRAKDQLIVTGHNWGPTQKTVRGPSLFLSEIKKVVDDGRGRVIEWQEVDSEDSNPNLESVASHPWPQNFNEEKRKQLLQAKEILERAAQSSPAQPELTAEETTLVNSWDVAIEYLLKEIETNTNPIKKVQVPTNLNVTKTIDLMKDPERFAKDLLRPMPTRPFVQTKRGTQFHLWVENFYKQSGLWDPYDLPGADAQDSLDEAELKLMQESFKNSSWAQLKPLEVEWDFDIKIANRFIKGRVDAVFKIENKILIVDWKTGQKENSNPLQLAIYRLAWFNRFATDLADISAAFVYLPSLEKVEPDYLPNLAEIEELFINA